MDLTDKLELVSRCMKVLLDHGQPTSKDSFYYDIDGMRIDAWRWQEDCTELQLSLRAWRGDLVFSVRAHPTIDIEEVERQSWSEDLAHPALISLRNLMVLDELAKI